MKAYLHFRWQTYLTLGLFTLWVVACAPPPAAPLDTPAVLSTEPATGAPTGTPAETSVPPQAGMDLRPLNVAAVVVEIGQGSPIPVEAVLSGDWPDLCAQLARIEPRVDKQRVEIQVLTTAADPACPPDNVGIPYRLALPLNMVAQAPGMYTVVVNGVETSFDWQTPGVQSASPAPTGEPRPISVADVQVTVGVGSPIPVEVVASGTWPDLCAQLAAVEQHITPGRIEITLLASPANAACPPDPLGLPFRFAVPLNSVNLPAGAYEVVVNGVATSFTWPSPPTVELPTTSETPASVMAYIGADGNVWALDYRSGVGQQVTTDAAPPNSEPNETVTYLFPRLSSDGRWVAYRRDAGKPVSWGMEFQVDLWVYDLVNGEGRQIYEKNPAGFAWKPGTHLLAFGRGVGEGYFTTRGAKPAAELATGISAFDADTGEIVELVQPERGYALYGPGWSPDGRFLTFDELYTYEGRGLFAYYDFEAQAYIAWDEPIGNFSWSPDGASLAYDRLTYTATGTERIYLRARVDGAESRFSPDFEQGYASFPVFSPAGDRIAYLANLGGPDTTAYTLYVQELQSAEPTELGVFESAVSLSWSADGSQLIFSFGPYGQEQIMAVTLVDGTSTILVSGWQPALAGR